MYRNHRVGVVLPAYNEAGHVGAVIDSVPAFVDRVYVVDDASTDETWKEIVRHAALTDGRRGLDGEGDSTDGPTVVTIRHADNRGAGGAIKTGYLRALQDDVDIVATVDADGQQDPRDIDRLFDPIVEGRADYAKGNRLLIGHRGEMPRHRFVGNVLLGMLTKIASGYWEIGDPQTGFTAISRRALGRVDVANMYEFYGYPNDLLVRLNVAEMRVIDVPVPNHYGDEESHIKYRTYIPRVSWLLLRRFLWRLRTKYLVAGFHPLVFVYAIGTIAVGAGFVAGISVLAVGVPAARAEGIVAAGGISFLLVLLGVLSWTIAMVLDREANASLSDRWIDDDRDERSSEEAPAIAMDPLDQRIVDGGRVNAPSNVTTAEQPSAADSSDH